MALRPDDSDMVFPLVSREEWIAMPARSVQDLKAPAPYVRYTYTDTEKCNTTEDCTRVVQELQRRDIHKYGLADLRYNWIVGGDGKIYEGRGWSIDAERPPEYNKLKGKCIDVAYVGNYSNEHPPWDMLKTGLDILKHGLKHKHINPNYEIIPYRDDLEKKTS